ncbi:mannosyltransferase family protein [Corynebacterium sp. H113]|uniref:mannosyltransferase family protein n=1 Tax=Corynebacterium sp. H113 TaxID=3133419 RepID=UPI003097DA56
MLKKRAQTVRAVPAAKSEATLVIAGYVATRAFALLVLFAMIFADATKDGDSVPRNIWPLVWDELNAWDAEWLARIAEHGYFDIPPVGDEPVYWQSLAFFPGMPYLMKAVSTVTTLSPQVAGIVISLVSGLVFAFSAAALVRRMPWVRASALSPVLAALLATTAPMTITFLMPYTEALFLALVGWGLVAIVDKRWASAAALVFAAGLVRSTALGLFIVLAIAVLATARRNPRAWAAVVVAPLGWAGYLWWSSSHLADVGGYFGAQERGWDSRVDGGVATIAWLTRTLTEETHVGYILTTATIIAVPLTAAWAFVGWVRALVGARFESDKSSVEDLWGRAWPVLLFSCLAIGQILVSDGLMHSRPRLFLSGVLLLIVVPAVLRNFTTRTSAWLIVTWVVVSTWFSAFMLVPFEWAI